MLSKLMQFKCIMDGGLGAKRPVAGKVLQFLEKNNHFNAIWVTFQAFLKPLKRTKLLKFKNLLEIPKLPSHFSPVYLQIKFKPRLKVCIHEQARSQKFAMGGTVLGVRGWNPQCSKILLFFCKNNLILGLF